jgi:hypothetical protein
VKVDLISIDQRFSLDSGESYTVVVVVLPSGHLLSLPASAEACEALLAEQAGQDIAPVDDEVPAVLPKVASVARIAVPQAPLDQTPFQLPDVTPPEQPAPVGTVHWPSLPESRLPLDYRQVFVSSGVPEHVTTDEFLNIMHTISANLSEVEAEQEARRAEESAEERAAEAWDPGENDDDGVDQL